MAIPTFPKSLYDPSFEQDSCGVGFLARPSSAPSHDIVEKALTAVVNLTHRGALDADAKTGDGAGVLFQVPRRFFLREGEKLALMPYATLAALLPLLLLLRRRNV